MYAVRQYIQDFCVCTVLLHTWVFLCAQILSYEKGELNYVNVY